MTSSFQNPLFIDIETVPLVAEWEQLPFRLQQLWRKKSTYLGYHSEAEHQQSFKEKAALSAEFGKVVAIAVGYVTKEENKHIFRSKGLGEQQEKELLNAFIQLLQQFPLHLQLCGHNIKSFDLPYLSRRILVNGLSLPSLLQLQGKKPWEITHIDTMELWCFGDHRHMVSLDLLAALFHLPSSKHIMEGSEVANYFYQNRDLTSIVNYCIEDVRVTAQIFHALMGLPPIDQW